MRYITKDEDGRNGHNTYFYSPESKAYLDECGGRLAQLTADYDGSVPEDVLADFMESVDKRRANTADPALMDEIDSFLTELHL